MGSRGSGGRGLVLGAGGVLGAAWTVGALAAVEQRDGWDPRTAETIIGTSAGSVLSAALGSGLGVSSLLDNQYGVVSEDQPQVDYDHDATSPLPPLPRPGIGSPRGVLNAWMHPMRITPMAAISTVMPRGRGTMEPVGALVEAFSPGGGWAAHERTWVVAMDYDSGRRVPFGRPGSPLSSLKDAVMASCAIPGWYAPVTIGGRRYVDGGTCSPTSVDLAGPLELDEVVVLAPMCALDYDSPTAVASRIERRFRRLVTKRVAAEIRKVARTGTKVTFLAPTAEDLAAIGANMMDPRRRSAVLETSLRTSRASLEAASLTATG